MIDRQAVFEVHRLRRENLSVRQISQKLGLNRRTVQKYLQTPFSTRPAVARTSKLAPFYQQIEDMLAIDPQVSAVVIRQHLQELGYDGGLSILKNHLQQVRPKRAPEPFIRFESGPGEQMQLDWGHFGSLTYGKWSRKLYALAITECHSRKLYVEFTHSQKQDTLHQCIANAFEYFGGTTQRLVVDNMLTAVLENFRPFVRFNDAFLDFLLPFAITPQACNVRAAHEKGKIESNIKYIRRNFWPLRRFAGLWDVNAQVLDWMHRTANCRVHQTTGEPPDQRFVPSALRKLPETLPDIRHAGSFLVHKDFGVRFDANTYTVPPWAINKKVTVKADAYTVTIFHKDQVIARHTRHYDKKQRIELPQHREQVRKLHHKLWKDRQIGEFVVLGDMAADYLKELTDRRLPIKKNVEKLLQLKDLYGTPRLLDALSKAVAHKAYGAEYIEHILVSHQTPPRPRTRVTVTHELLARATLQEPSLTAYDNLLIERNRHESSC
jgi:transposase